MNDNNGLTVVLHGPEAEVYVVESYIQENGFNLTNFSKLYLSIINFFFVCVLQIDNR